MPSQSWWIYISGKTQGVEVGGCSIIIIMINNISNAPSQMSPRHKKSTANKMFEGAGVGVGGSTHPVPNHSQNSLLPPQTSHTQTMNHYVYHYMHTDRNVQLEFGQSLVYWLAVQNWLEMWVFSWDLKVIKLNGVWTQWTENRSLFQTTGPI